MEQETVLFDAKLKKLAEEYRLLADRIAVLEKADHDEIRKARAHLEAEWADTVVDLKNRSRTMRYVTGQQLSAVQLDYCRKAADILHDSVKKSWAAMAGGSEADDTVLYAEYAIDFASLAMRHALLAVVSAMDMQLQEEEGKNVEQ